LTVATYQASHTLCSREPEEHAQPIDDGLFGITDCRQTEANGKCSHGEHSDERKPESDLFRL
jgi:hypothetical protein